MKFWRRPGWMVEEEAGLEVRGEWNSRFGSAARNKGIWSRLGALRDAWRGKRSRRVGEGERGAYVQLDSYEAV